MKGNDTEQAKGLYPNSMYVTALRFDTMTGLGGEWSQLEPVGCRVRPKKYIRADLLPGLEDLALICRIVKQHQSTLGLTARTALLNLDTFGDYYEHLDDIWAKLSSLCEMMDKDSLGPVPDWARKKNDNGTE